VVSNHPELPPRPRPRSRSRSPSTSGAARHAPRRDHRAIRPPVAARCIVARSERSSSGERRRSSARQPASWTDLRLSRIQAVTKPGRGPPPYPGAVVNGCPARRALPHSQAEHHS
jgi:hypothetical protein